MFLFQSFIPVSIIIRYIIILVNSKSVKLHKINIIIILNQISERVRVDDAGDLYKHTYMTLYIHNVLAQRELVS